ncbi:signal transduction histidine kinase [Saccharopolyspora lacisalsi]|uniref:Signal transduction histidine kinase n=2 Tax=Halosaccharopolyspora lacisalsi TaxID=1000566 RepID=A0A839E4A7_9PSEU|nr:signal transduction histidine kinase [Halosaccharopolyspora lacisalsi]
MRVVMLCYALIWFTILVDDYAYPLLGTAVLVVMALWTAFTIHRYRHRSGRTNRLVLADQVVVTALFAICALVMTDDQLKAGLPTVVTIWQGSMVTSAAVQWGMLGGGICGVVAAVGNLLMRGLIDSNMAMDTVLHVGTGLLLGLASDTAVRSTERLSKALRAEAATAERERLARSIHDSVLQVLARVRKRGAEMGGEAADLARLAGEQEVTLRALIASSPPEPDEDGGQDLAARLQALSTARVQISVPATPVPLPVATASDLFSTVREALENADRHAGDEARVWVLLEDLTEEVVISIRDDGEGIPEGRLAVAESQGRMGVAQSIRGRVEGLGGTATLETAPGEGTEWELRVPRPESSDRQHGSGHRGGVSR